MILFHYVILTGHLLLPLHNALMPVTCAPFITFVSIDLGGAPDPLADSEWLEWVWHTRLSLINRAVCYHVIIRGFPSIAYAIIEFETRIIMLATHVSCM